MRKSFVALALLVGAATMLTTVAIAQDSRDRDEGVKVMNAQMAQQRLLTKSARLNTSANGDTFFIGHTTIAPYSEPWHVGRGPYLPGSAGYDGMWDFDTYDNGVDAAHSDSMQGWIPVITPNTRSAGTLADYNRSWQCLDWGNRMCASPVQGRTPGIISAWHVDNGNFPLYPEAAYASMHGGVNDPPQVDNDWTPLAGSKSAWCGLRSGQDFSVVDQLANGGTGNHLNGEAVIGVFTDGVYNTNKNFPGYGNQWDQLLYRDVRVADNSTVKISFLYETQMDPRSNSLAASCKGWFDKDPTSLQQGGGGVGASNFISSTAHPVAGTGPVDSFMVYVGVPTNPTSCQYADGNAKRPVFDLKRRWFSEVIAIDKPYKELLSTFGSDSAYKSTALEFTLTSDLLTSLLSGQGNGGGVIRFVFRTKTNANYSDETNTGGSFVSTNKGAVRIDAVSITGVAVPVSSGFEAESEINNSIEAVNSDSPGPAVGVGYALGAWHATGKSPKLMAHLHPLFDAEIGPGNFYAKLAWADLCGEADSPGRSCNVNNVIMSSTDHDLNEAAGVGSSGPFKENRNGFVSPTINLVTEPEAVPGSGIWPVNNNGLDQLHVFTNDDWWIFYDMYSGIFAPASQGNVWGNSILSYPVVQANGATVWGDLGFLTGVWSNGTKQCFLMSDVLKPNIFTSNESGIPDSCKLYIFREQRCISWGVTTGCSPIDGHYTDNIALVLPPPILGAADKISIDIWDWYTDAFPANEAVVPGTVAFDTCGAYIQNARNNSASTGDLLRFDIPGDSMYIKAQNADGTPLRMDCVFRVFPGPGNYVEVGNKNSGVRKVTANAAAGFATSSDRSNFWGEYMAYPGRFSKGLHGTSTWNVDTWNSVRCDTVEVNFFPNDKRADNLPGIQEDFWMSTIYDPKDAGDEDYTVDLARITNLGIDKHRCFMINDASDAPLDHTNITCSYVPGWVTLHPDTTGYAGTPTTKEYTKIFPDGLLTAGSHIQYFYRMSHLSTPETFVMCPDTNRVSPQPTGSAWNYDGMRWEDISILPDRWKDVAYGGIGSACMLVVDLNDRRGDDRGWVGIADSIGATVAAKYGARNGWHADATYTAPGNSLHNFAGDPELGDDPAIAVWANRGQAGTTWDIYDVKAAESSNTGSCQIGGRLISTTGMGLLAGKQSKQGPTPDMLIAYYRMLFLMSGDLDNAFFGAITNRGQKDVELVRTFLTSMADQNDPRGVWVMGAGFVETGMTAGTQQLSFNTTELSASLNDPSYYDFSGAHAEVPYPDLLPQPGVIPPGTIYAVQNTCNLFFDVLNVEGSEASVASFYENIGLLGPYISGVYAPSTEAHPYVALTDGWDLLNMFCRGGGSTVGRMSYFIDVMVNTFGDVCSFTAAPTVDVTAPSAQRVSIDFLGNVQNNPMKAGMATVNFGLAKSDRVEVKVYDVTGRLVKTLANKNFEAGPHSLKWDGSNDQGQAVSRGVYFTQVKFINSRFEGAKKVTVLK